MYAVNYSDIFNLDDLLEPSETAISIFEESKKSIGWDNNIEVFLYVYPKHAHECMFAGVACKLSNEAERIREFFQKNLKNIKSSPYCIIVPYSVFNESLAYIRWVFEHELKHCQPNNGIFKWHDFQLLDTGWEFYHNKPNAHIGFFHDDMRKIGCCDDLMFMFKNVDGIDDYL